MTDHPPEPDALLPPDMAARAERIGAEKTRLPFQRLIVLAILAGAFIAFGAMLSTIVATTGAQAMPYGLLRLVTGLAFSLGLILVVVGGAELFTGNNLMVMAWASGSVTTAEVLRAWAIVYIGNLVGAVATALLVFLSGLHEQGGGAVGAQALDLAQQKAALDFVPALVRGILANVLVCLAVWLCYGARSITDRILALSLPVAAFVAAGFEHSIANMYILPYGLFVKAWAAPEFWTAIAQSSDAFAGLTWSAFLANLIPVTIGNVIGGGVLVGAVYWFVYLRRSGKP